MNRLTKKNQNTAQRKNRVRATVSGTSERPRLTVTITNLHASAQIIDDTKHHTIVSMTTVADKKAIGTMTEKAAYVGEEIAKKAKAKKVTKVVFDRNGRKYHGRIKAMAEAARKNGLEF
jgi:large subunit ribosomal protein L18